MKFLAHYAGDRRRQKTRLGGSSGVPASRPAQDGDRLTVNFEGSIDGNVFQGGKAENFAFVLGEGRMLPEFETAARHDHVVEDAVLTMSQQPGVTSVRWSIANEQAADWSR